MKTKDKYSILSLIWLVSAGSSLLSMDDGGLFNVISSLILVVASFVGAGCAIYTIVKNKKARAK